jgi:Zn-dependent protease with chaperone function
VNPQDYKQLIRRLEVDSTVNPAAFHSKVVLICASAYFGLFGTLAGIAWLIHAVFDLARQGHSIVAMVRIGLFGLLMLPVFLVVLRMFFMRLPPPQGRVITAEEVPRLFDALAKMRRKLAGPRIHQVLIDSNYNASICQLPRFGLFGGHRNYLTLGLPYLLGVDTKEMLATVAHEYGHLCGNHGKLGAWAYRQRRIFGALYEQLSDGSEQNFIHDALAGVLARFMPYYNAYTFVLSRQNEYEADRTATELFGASVNASGLVRDALLARWIDEQFWPRLFKQADEAMRPSFMPFSAMSTAFKASYDQWATRENLAAAWAMESDLHDTHPALRDRVEATGEEVRLPACVDTSAAETLVGVRASKRLIEEFDEQWWRKERREWESRCKYVSRSRLRLQQLSALPMAAIALADLHELALLSAKFEAPTRAKPLLEHLLGQDGGPYPKAQLFYGRMLLNEGNSNGLEHLELAARHDRRLVDDIGQIGYRYLQKRGNEFAARAWLEKLTPEYA